MHVTDTGYDYVFDSLLQYRIAQRLDRLLGHIIGQDDDVPRLRCEFDDLRQWL